MTKMTKNVTRAGVNKIKNFTLLSSAYITSTITSLIITIILANSLSKKDFGIYRFALSILPVLAIFTLPGIHIAINKFAAQKKCINFTVVLKTKLMYGLSASIVAILIALYFYATQNNLYFHMMLALSIIMPFYNLFYIYNAYLIGKQEFKKVFIYELLSNIVKLVTVLFLILVQQKNGVLILFILITIKTFVDYILYLKVIDYAQKKCNDKQLNTHRLIKSGIKININTAIVTVANNIDKITVGLLFGPTLLAIYAVLTMAASQFTGFLSQTVNRLLFLEEVKQEYKKHNIKKALLIFGFVLFLLVLTSFITWLIFPFIFAEYKQYRHLLWLTIPLAMSIYLLDYLWFIFTARETHRNLAKVQIARILLYIIFMYLVYIKAQNLSADQYNIMVALVFIAATTANLFSIVYALVLNKINR